MRINPHFHGQQPTYVNMVASAVIPANVQFSARIKIPLKSEHEDMFVKTISNDGNAGIIEDEFDSTRYLAVNTDHGTDKNISDKDSVNYAVVEMLWDVELEQEKQAKVEEQVKPLQAELERLIEELTAKEYRRKMRQYNSGRGYRAPRKSSIRYNMESSPETEPLRTKIEETEKAIEEKYKARFDIMNANIETLKEWVMHQFLSNDNIYRDKAGFLI